MRKLLKQMGLLVLGAALVNCTGLTEKNALQAGYEKAIIDSAVVSPSKIQPLLPIPTLEKVTVISWVTGARVPCNGQQTCHYTTDSNRMWVTLEGEVKRQCVAWHLHGDALTQRLEQLLGLPPNSPAQYRKIKFVALQLDPHRLERACLGVNEQDALHPQCTLTTQTSTPDELKHYVQQQMADAYIVQNPQGPGYPFTRLGYTYDWNPVAKNHYGASEFLIMPNTVVNVIDIKSTDDYCQ